MKLLVVAAHLCGLMVLTPAAFLPNEDVSSGAGDLIPTAKIYRVNLSSDCRHGWTQLDDRCFLYVSRSMSWPAAEINCLSMGANLASVHSQREYHVIQKLTAPDGYKETWIGGTDASGENVWLWSDGTPFNYKHWCPGEPNNLTKQDCLKMNFRASKCWDDGKCHHRLPSVCAKKI